MPSLKCAQCGLVNFATATSCKRCGQALVVSSGADGIVLSDGYVLPPPPNMGTPGSGVWRDNSKLVVSKDALLPERCVKCNAPAPGPKFKKKLSWHHPAIYLLIVTGLLIYLIVAMVLRKSMTVELGLCEEHKEKHRRDVFITWGLILLGVAGFILALLVGDNTFLLLGILLLLAGIIYAVVAVRMVAPAKIDAQFAWLRGVNKDYLNELPHWPAA